MATSRTWILSPQSQATTNGPRRWRAAAPAQARQAVSKSGAHPPHLVREGGALKIVSQGAHAMVKRRAVLVFSMVVVALIAAGCVASSVPESSAPEPASHTIKTGGLYRVAKTDGPICENHDELVAGAYVYDGG